MWTLAQPQTLGTQDKVLSAEWVVADAMLVFPTDTPIPPTPTSVPIATATPVLIPAVAHVFYATTDVQRAFIDGFTKACVGQACGLLAHALIMVGGPSRVCPSGESGWNVYANNGRDLGLAQFDPSTWAGVGGGDIYDPYLQGDHTAVMLNQGRSSEWSCW